MKKLLLYLLLLLCCSNFSNAQTEIILNTTGNGFDKNTANGLDPDKWDRIQKFATLTYNGQDASVTAVRLHVQWQHYEPTLGNYQRAKIVTAIQTILGVKPGMKVALHFPYQRDGPVNDSYFSNDDIARTSAGALIQDQIAFTCPSIFSDYGKTRFYAFVDDVLDQLGPYYSSILYVTIGNSQTEEYCIPYNYPQGAPGPQPGMYEEKALQKWRTEYLPCRFPGQSTVTWGGTAHNISSAPSYTPFTGGDWNTDHGREYQRFASWGLWKFFEGFKAIVKDHSTNLKVLYTVSDFGGYQANIQHLHGASLVKAYQEADGIYTSDGDQNINHAKIRALDVMKGTMQNRIAAIEFDPDDLGQQPGSQDIWAGVAAEWLPRAYKHGANYVHLAMHYHDPAVNNLAPTLAVIRANYVNGSYTAPARQPSTTSNIVPTVFQGASAFQSVWSNAGGDNWSTTDNNPVSVNMTDAGYWENIWSCSSTCDFTPTASPSNPNPAANSSVTLTAACTGNNCSGITYTWSGNGISGTGTTKTFNAPATAGTYTYTVTASKSGCSDKTANVSITVPPTGCDFNMSVTASPTNPAANASVTLTSSCSGANCSGLTYSWSGNGISGTASTKTFNAPSTPGTYTYTLTTSRSGCSNKMTDVSITVPPAGGCGFTQQGVIGTWNGFQVQTRQFSVNGTTVWLVVTTTAGSPVDKHFPRGANFVQRGDISWSGTAPAMSCFGGGETGYNGLVIPSGITVPSGYGQFTEPDGAVYFAQTCTTPAAPSLSAAPASIASGATSNLTATGCSGNVVWSHGLGTGNTKSVSPATTTTYTATCTVGTCTSTNGSVTVTVTPPPGGPNCNTLSSDVNGINCLVMEGWVYDQSSPNATVNIDIYEGSTLVMSNVPADKFRQDLLNAGYGNGYHAFEILTPAAYKNGQNHTFTFKVTGCSSYQLNSSPKTFNCSGSRVAGPPSNPAAAITKIAISDTTLTPLRLYPNPSSGRFEVNFYLKKGKKATLLVTDVVGRVIQRRMIAGNGQHKETIQLAGSSSGAIFVQLRKDDGVEIKKALIIK